MFINDGYKKTYLQIIKESFLNLRANLNYYLIYYILFQLIPFIFGMILITNISRSDFPLIGLIILLVSTMANTLLAIEINVLVKSIFLSETTYKLLSFTRTNIFKILSFGFLVFIISIIPQILDFLIKEFYRSSIIISTFIVALLTIYSYTIIVNKNIWDFRAFIHSIKYAFKNIKITFLTAIINLLFVAIGNNISYITKINFFNNGVVNLHKIMIISIVHNITILGKFDICVTNIHRL